MKPYALVWLWLVALLSYGCVKRVVTDDDTMQPYKLVPLAAGVNPEEIRIKVDDEISLSAWWFGRKFDRTILVFHDDSHLFGAVPIVNALSGLPINILMIDYRGYGISSGEPSEEGLYRDAEAAWDFLVKQKEIPSESIVVYGRRLGASLALDLASKRQVGGLVLEYVFASAPRLVEEIDEHFPFYVNLQAEPGEKFDNLAKAAKCSVPMLFVSSSGNNYFPNQAKQVMEASASKEKRLVSIKGDIETEPDAFAREISSFLDLLSSQ